jgi:hypothetical protein
MNELEDLIRELLVEADHWLNNKSHLKLQRLIQIARAGVVAKQRLDALELTLELEQEREAFGAAHPEGAPI